MKEYNLTLGDVPYVIQINKRDLPDAVPAEMIKKILDPTGKVQFYEGVAAKFQGVFEPPAWGVEVGAREARPNNLAM